MTFERKIPGLSISTTLAYIALVVNSRGDYSYTTSGSFVENDETEYNTLITWSDPDPKPLWSDIQLYYWDANEFFNITIPDAEKIDNLEEYQFDIDDQFADLSVTIANHANRLDIIEEGELFALADHNHDSRYYTKSQIDTSLAGKTTEGYVDTQIGLVNTALATKVDKVSGKGLSTNDYSNTEKSKLAALGGGAHLSDNAIDAATNSPTDAPTNLNVITTLLGALTGEVNATNARQNTIANNLNALATKYNAAETKFNLLLDRLEAQAILLP